MFELTRRNHNKPVINPFAELEEMERQFFSRPFSFFETGMRMDEKGIVFPFLQVRRMD